MPARLIQAQTAHTRQPPNAIAPDWSNPLSRGLQLLWRASDPANRNSARREGAVASGTGIATQAYPQGLARTFDGGTNYLTWLSGETSTNRDFTILLVARSHVAGGSAQRFFHVGDKSGTAGGVLNVSESGNLRYTKLGVAAITSFVPCQQNAPCIVALTYNATTGDCVFAARNLLTGTFTTGTSTNATAHGGNNGEIGLSHAGGEGGNCAIFMSAFWWRTLSELEIAKLVLRNPWQLFAPRKLVLPRQVTGTFIPAWARSQSGMIGAR